MPERLLADAGDPGSALRNEVARYLRAIHGHAEVEVRDGGKKVDVVSRYRDFGREITIFAEAKDYAVHLSRAQATAIAADYEEQLERTSASILLIVTRNGLSPDADAYIAGRARLRHQTIWELEAAVLDLADYARGLRDQFTASGLAEYYVPLRVRPVLYDISGDRVLGGPVDLEAEVDRWLQADDGAPLALLGDYGAGKTSFSQRLAARKADAALRDPTARRPILIRLGDVTRASGLEELLGGLFTNTVEVRGYSFQRFMELNARGRFLVILDGFDEMKHAMTWTEFRNEVRQLNRLNVGAARVLLLGRPSAFTTDEEHMYVLRGRQAVAGGAIMRVDGWPEFREYDLEPFDRAQRAGFVERYLASRLAADAGDTVADPGTRAAEVNAIADSDEAMFGKPVHSRILVDLALAPGFDLTPLVARTTRWNLYESFICMLAERETEKAARSPIEAPDRLRFLEAVALWLWRERDGATSFVAAGVPTSITDQLPDVGADLDAKRREYLTGSVLERKAGDAYYFAHRSFAEFLVARRMVANPPSGGLHGEYAPLVRDGVLDFLGEASEPGNLSQWWKTLGDARGVLDLEYVLEVAKRGGGATIVARGLDGGSPWKPLMLLIDVRQTADHTLAVAVHAALREASPVGAALLFFAIARLGLLAGRVQDARGRLGLPQAAAAPALAGVLLGKVLQHVREGEPSRRLTITEDGTDWLHLARAALSASESFGDHVVMLDWHLMASTAEEMLVRAGLGLRRRTEPLPDDQRPRSALIRYADLSPYVQKAAQPYLRELLRGDQFLSAISVAGFHPPRRRIQPDRVPRPGGVARPDRSRR